MMGLVAMVVAVVILVFFALGYVFGLLFLIRPCQHAGFHPHQGSTYTRGSHFPMLSLYSE